MENRKEFNPIRWANAPRVQDDHDRFMAQIESEAVILLRRKK